MNKTVAGIVGGIIGFFVGHQVASLGVGLLLSQIAPDDNSVRFAFMYTIALVLGGIPGAIIGITVAHRLLSSSEVGREAAGKMPSFLKVVGLCLVVLFLVVIVPAFLMVFLIFGVLAPR